MATTTKTFCVLRNKQGQYLKGYWYWEDRKRKIACFNRTKLTNDFTECDLLPAIRDPATKKTGVLYFFNKCKRDFKGFEVVEVSIRKVA